MYGVKKIDLVSLALQVWLAPHGRYANAMPIFLPHFRLYEVVSLHMSILPYKYRKILNFLLKLM